jgi:OmpA-OmpF porin, OOP family
MRTMLTCLALCATFVPAGGMAQDLSEDELLQLFLAQRDAYKAVLEGRTDTELTRELTLITADDVEIVTEAPADTATASTEAATTEVADLAVSVEPAEQPVVEETKATLVKMPASIGVNIRVEFGFDSAALTDEQKPKLQKLCNVMKGSDINLFRIIGHTDSSGSDDYNERLSRLRAEEVQRYFINDCGIDAKRLEAVGLGERFLLEDYDPKSDQNRRVEFQALS